MAEREEAQRLFDRWSDLRNAEPLGSSSCERDFRALAALVREERAAQAEEDAKIADGEARKHLEGESTPMTAGAYNAAREIADRILHRAREQGKPR